MNKFFKAAALAFGAFGLASAQGSLWGPSTDDFPSLQVKVPDAAACWATNPTAEEGNPCYDATAGWWFGYGDKGKSGEGTFSTKVFKEGEWVDFGEGVSISNSADGTSLIGADGLRVSLTAGAAKSSDEPTISGIGFNYKKPEAGEDISGFGGYCITYTLTGSKLQLELGWDEDTYNYDTWFAELVAGTKKVSDFNWDGSVTNAATKISGDFKKDGWGAGTQQQAIGTAINGAYSLKIRLKNGTTTETSAEFTLHQLGKTDECTDAVAPIVSGSKSIASSVAMNVVGRTLSFSRLEKAVSVQLVNLQGAVVASQTIAPSKSMNLSNLPTGVYMVRVSELGYTNKIMLK